MVTIKSHKPFLKHLLLWLYYLVTWPWSSALYSLTVLQSVTKEETNYSLFLDGLLFSPLNVDFSGRWECCLFPNDTVDLHISAEKACNYVAMEIIQLLKKMALGKKKQRLLASCETTSSRTFAPQLLGVLPGHWSPFSGCWQEGSSL